jgi:hypothetical protein
MLKRATMVAYWTAGMGVVGVASCTLITPLNGYVKGGSAGAVADGGVDSPLVDSGDVGASDDGSDDDGAEADSPLPPPDVQVLADREEGPLRVTVDDGYVYWTSRSGQTIRRVSKQGGTVETLAQGQPSPEDIAVDDTFVYWTNTNATGSEGAVMKISKTAMDGGIPTTLATNQSGAEGIALDADYVYWVLFDGGVRRVLKSGGTPQDLAPSKGAKYITTRGGYVFWAGPQNDAIALPNNGFILRVMADGTGLTTIASEQPGTHDVKADDSFVYWTNYSASGAAPVVSKAPAGQPGPVTPLAQGDGPEQDGAGIAIDDRYAYYTLFRSNRVRRVPLSGGTSELVADGQKGAFGVAVDDLYVYWANYLAGTIARAQKP